MGDRLGVVVMAYGTPASPDDVEAYYTHIRRGRPPTPEQLADLVRRYDAIGGTSPLAERTEAQRAGLAAALDERAPGRCHGGARPEARAAVHRGRGGDARRRRRRRHRRPRARAALLPGVGRRVPGAAGGGRAARTLPVAHHRQLAPRADVPRLPRRARCATRSRRCPSAPRCCSPPTRSRSACSSTIRTPTSCAESAAAVAEAVGLDRWAGWSIAWQSAGRTPEPWRGPDVLDGDPRPGRHRTSRRRAGVPAGLRERPPRGGLRPRHRGGRRRRRGRARLRPHPRAQRRPRRARRAGRPRPRRRADDRRSSWSAVASPGWSRRARPRSPART